VPTIDRIEQKPMGRIHPTRLITIRDTNKKRVVRGREKIAEYK